MKDDILEELKKIISFKLINAGRASNMVWLVFEKGSIEYSIHIQCAWRFINNNEIKIGMSDIYEPNSTIAEKDIKDFEWDVQGANLFDEKVNDLLKENLVVKKVEVDNFAGFKIHFDNGYILETFSDTSINDEEWRMFESNMKNAAHFVIEGTSSYRIK